MSDEHPHWLRNIYERRAKRIVQQQMAEDALKGLKQQPLGSRVYSTMPQFLQELTRQAVREATTTPLSWPVFSVEALFGIASAILIAAVPMSFWFAAFLWFVLLGLFADFVWRSSLTASQSSRWKGALTLVLLAVGIPMGYFNAKTKEHEGLDPNRIADAVVQKLALRSASAPADAQQRAERLELRNQIGILLQQGRIHQANLLSITQGRMPEAKKRVGRLVQDILRYHVAVINFTEHNFGHAEAMKVSVPQPAVEYPKNIMSGVKYAKRQARGGYDLRGSWDSIVGDTSTLEHWLSQFPEIKP
jgi:hypothetical protein